jgi:choline dehydrogenase-like flavoprotein
MSSTIDRASSAAVDFDLIVIGSGPGGAMAAYPSVMTGKRVLMVERGDWVHRSRDNWGPTGFFELTPAYSLEAPYQVVADEGRPTTGTVACVGGATVFFGGASLRLREADFQPDPEIDADSGGAWPYRYADLEPYYARAEELFGVAGVAGDDPTESWRSSPYPGVPAPLAPISARIAAAARDLGLRPFRLPLAINYAAAQGRERCIACGTCDGFACAIGAKNDLATSLIPRMQRAGMTLKTNTVATRLVLDGSRIDAVECIDRMTRAPLTFRSRAVVVAAGALATPHLLLASGLERANPAGHAVGRYLMRHCNSVVMRWFLKAPAPDQTFHKQVGVNDYYFGHDTVARPSGKLGCIQQWATPQADFLASHFSLPHWSRDWFSRFVSHLTGLIVIAEDRPQAANRVFLDPSARDAFGMPRASVIHHYHQRDLDARRALVRAARRILRRTGPGLPYVHEQRLPTFSHAVGTVRMGPEPAHSPVDGSGAFRGLDNLFISDGSVFPRSGGVNPSLTIAANALRTGERVAAGL